MKSDGILKWSGLEDDFTSELALELDEEPENIKVTLAYLLSCGLAETDDSINYFFPFAVSNVGSESTVAQRVRDYRKKAKEEALNETENNAVTPLLHCNTEKEIEKDTRGKRQEEDIEADIENTEDSCAEPETVSAPPIISIILNDKTFFDVFFEDYNRWCELYPAVNVMQELRKMSSWSTDNPKRRKTKSGIRRFINAWLSKEQDKGGQYRYQGGSSSGNVFTDIAEGMRNGQA